MYLLETLVNALICFRLVQINVCNLLLNTSLIQTAEWRMLDVILITDQFFAIMYAPRS